MKRVMTSLLLGLALLNEVGGTIGTYAVLSAQSAHAEPCGGRGYPQDGGSNSP